MKNSFVKKWHFIICLLLMSNLIYAQRTTTIRGVVTSSTDNLPVIGATIQEKGTLNGTITDPDGEFSLQVSTQSVLVVKYVGFLPQEIVVGSQREISIILQEDVKNLNEVIVTGYMSQRKADLTGSVAVVDMADIKDLPGGNVMKDLRGRVPGLFITSGGSPRNEATVRIRGISTFSNKDPLYIIDGVPTKAAMHELNDNDIESIQVLKDASSATIYGSRASNGVILITTKKGKKGDKPRVTYEGALTMQKYTTKLQMLSTQQWAESFWQASVNDGVEPLHQQFSFDWTRDANGKAILNQVILPEYLDDEATMRPSNTDWFDAITRTGISHKHNLTISNGTDRSSTLFSLGYQKNEGIIKHTDMEKISLRLNNEYNLIDGILTIGENFTMSYLNEVKDPGVMGLALIQHPIIPVRTGDGGWGGPVSGMSDRHNPVRLLEDTKQNREHFVRTFGNLYATLQPIKNLAIRTNFGLDYGNFYTRTMGLKYKTGILSSDINSVNQKEEHTLNWTWSNTANYTMAFQNQTLDMMIGIEAIKYRNEFVWGSRESFALEDINYMYVGTGTANKNNDGGGDESTMLSYFAKVNYSYKDRYLLSGTVRRDGSSRFGKNHRYGTFPAFSVGWRITGEDFFKENLEVISNLKFRYGWGITGNQEGLGSNAIYNVYTSGYDGSSYDINGNKSGNLPSGYYRTSRQNPDLKWEQTKQSNVGVDFSLFNHNLTGSFDYFIKKTEGILIYPPNVATGGEGYDYWVNGASVENKGFELALGYSGQGAGGFRYSFTGSISHYANKVTYLPNAVVNAYGGNGYEDTILGHPIDMMYGYVVDGIFQNQAEVDRYAAQNGKGVGRLRFKNLNDDDEVSDRYDRTWIGNPHPDFIYGFNTNLQHKQFDLSIFFQGVAGIDVYNDNKKYTDFFSIEPNNNKGTRLLDAWTPENRNSKIPVLSLDSNEQLRTSTYFVESGAYLKLRSVSVGYTFKPEVIQKLKMQNLRVYLVGENLLTFKKTWGDNGFTGVDPENVGNGYPNPLTITFGLNVSF